MAAKPDFCHVSMIIMSTKYYWLVEQSGVFCPFFYERRKKNIK